MVHLIATLITKAGFTRRAEPAVVYRSHAEAAMVESFKRVWWRSGPQTKWFGKAMEDVGTLEVGSDGLTFRGKESVRQFPAPVSVRFGLQGVDRRVSWAELRFPDGSLALFADGRWYGNVWGGTKRLAVYLKQVYGVGEVAPAITADDARWNTGVVAMAFALAGPVLFTIGAFVLEEPFIGLGAAFVVTAIAFVLVQVRASPAMKAANRLLEKSK